MAIPKLTHTKENSIDLDVPENSGLVDCFGLQEVISTDTLALDEDSVPLRPVHSQPVLPKQNRGDRKLPPRKCGIATFTTDLCDSD